MGKIFEDKNGGFFFVKGIKIKFQISSLRFEKMKKFH